MISSRSVFSVLLAAVVIFGIAVSPLAVSGQQDTGELRVASADGETDIAQGDSQTIEVFYTSPGSYTPQLIEFDLTYDQDVLSVPENGVSSGGYLGAVVNSNVSNGTVDYLEFSIDPNPTVNPNQPVATIEFTPADGADVGEQTNLELTNALSAKGDSSRTLQRINKTVTITEGAQNTPDYNVKIQNPTLSQTPVDETPGDHTLNFDVVNVSADDEPDNFTVTLPKEVTVENIVSTTVTDASEKRIDVSDDPADADNPGRELKFAVDPTSQATAVKTLTVEVEMKLSATP